MKKNTLLFAGFCGLSLMMGCATTDPLSLEVTAADREIFRDANAPNRSGVQYKILVVSKADNHLSDSTYDKALAVSARSSVMKYFSNLGWFETIDEKNGIALDVGDLLGKDGRLTSEAIGEAAIDFVLTVNSSVAYPGSHFKWHEFWGGGRYTHYSSKAYGADVTTEFSLIKACDNKPVMSCRFRSRRLCASSRTIKAAIDEATDANAAKFAQVVASRFLPPVKVLETRGNGRCARIKMGSNYMVSPETDKSPATIVEFITHEKGVENRGDGKPVIEKIPFARGEVIKTINNRESWVEIYDWEKAKVRRGHYVRVSEQSVSEATKDEF